MKSSRQATKKKSFTSTCKRKEKRNTENKHGKSNFLSLILFIDGTHHLLETVLSIIHDGQKSADSF